MLCIIVKLYIEHTTRCVEHICQAVELYKEHTTRYVEKTCNAVELYIEYSKRYVEQTCQVLEPMKNFEFSLKDHYLSSLYAMANVLNYIKSTIARIQFRDICTRFCSIGVMKKL